MTRPTEALSCNRCMNLRTKNGKFWCRQGIDKEPAFEPRTHRTEWLGGVEGKKWARDTAQVCPLFEGEENEVVEGKEELVDRKSDGENE